MDQQPIPSTAPTFPAPAIGIDAGAACLVAANPGGWRAWGLDPATVSPPVAIDAAMPALNRLREIANGQDGGFHGEEALTFWTARGLVRRLCRVETRAGPVPGGAVTVTLLEAEPARGAAAQASSIRPARNGIARIPGAADGLQCERLGVPREVAMSAWLAHELRTPLSAVIAYAEILEKEHFGPLANPRYRDYARDIYASARHALSVVDSLLRDEPAPSVVPPLAFADLDPVGVVESCLAVARPLAARAGLELGAAYAPRLPRIVADELSLKQMLLNLLANAIKFARAGDRVTVTVACDGTGPLTIAVADTGPGMGCRPLGSADQPAQPGLGLGLPMTRALAAANGAELTIESTPGEGTRVTIAFGKERVVPV